MAMSPAERLLVLAAVAVAVTSAWAAPRPGGEGDASASAAASGPAPGVVGAKKFATAVDCNGAVAFSSKGAAPAAGDAGQLHFAADLTDKSVGWSRDAGEFTTFCPGLYQFAFSSGGAAKAKLVLKKKLSGGSAWDAVVSTGAGGANVVLLNMDVGDSTAVFLEDGALGDDDAPSATFSGFRVAKKTP